MGVTWDKRILAKIIAPIFEVSCRWRCGKTPSVCTFCLGFRRVCTTVLAYGVAKYELSSKDPTVAQVNSLHKYWRACQYSQRCWTYAQECKELLLPFHDNVGLLGYNDKQQRGDKPFQQLNRGCREREDHVRRFRSPATQRARRALGLQARFDIPVTTNFSKECHTLENPY